MNAVSRIEHAGSSHDSHENSACGFCQQPFLDSEEPTRRTRCGHRLHLLCMNEHLPRTKCCPVCDQTISNWKNITNKCVVCMQDLFGSDCVLETKCRHLFHENCLRDYILDHKRCPICRRDVSYALNYLDDMVDDLPFQDMYLSDQSENDDYDKICAICRVLFAVDRSEKRRTACGHRLHLHCMNSYLPEAKKCPICSCKIKWINVSDKCVVCLDLFDSDDATTDLPCQHEAHASCLEQWTTTKKRCPICRCPLKVAGGECSICLENIHPKDAKRLPCEHVYHSNCVSHWLQNEQTCPLCRVSVSL